MSSDEGAKKPAEGKRLTRRRLLAGLAAGAGAAVAGRAVAASADERRGLAPRDDSNSAPGSGPSAVGARSLHEQPQRLAMFGAMSLTPLQALHGTLTPADLHFERHHAGVPTVDPEQYRLMLHGMVERPQTFSLADLVRLPSITRTCFIECSGNLHIKAGEKTTPQALCGLTSQSEWTGVALSTLLREVGAKPKASWLLAEGGDAALMTRSIPARKAWDDAMIAYAQNGEAIRPEQGYPARLLLPGWEGNTHIKWIRRVEVSDQAFMTREETSKYTDPLADGTARQFSVVMDARSVITHPTYPDRIEKGWHEIRGLAWTGRGRISRVEVSVDAGRSWWTARLVGPVLPTAHTRFTLPWKWDGSETEILSRAIDETGYLQPTRRQLIDARGPGSIPYHLNSILAWRVLPSGEVLYKAEPWA